MTGGAPSPFTKIIASWLLDGSNTSTLTTLSQNQKTWKVPKGIPSDSRRKTLHYYSMIRLTTLMTERPPNPLTLQTLILTTKTLLLSLLTLGTLNPSQVPPP